MEAARSTVLNVEGATLLSTSVDGTSYYSHWCRKMAIDYLRWKNNQTGVIGSNHNLKNLRYHMIGGSYSPVVGVHVIDMWLIKMGGVAWDLIRVNDFASDLIVLKLF